MLNSYRDILTISGAWKFSLAGLIARFPMSIVGISQILMISTLYGSYTLAGQVSATNIVSYAIFAPVLARLVDRYGQARIMIPAVTISSLALVGVIVSALLQAPVALLYFHIAALAWSLGSMVRSRWTNAVRLGTTSHGVFDGITTMSLSHGRAPSSHRLTTGVPDGWPGAGDHAGVKRWLLALQNRPNRPSILLSISRRLSQRSRS